MAIYFFFFGVFQISVMIGPIVQKSNYNKSFHFRFIASKISVIIPPITAEMEAVRLNVK